MVADRVWSSDAVIDVHRSTNARRRGRIPARRRSVGRRVVAWAVALAAVAGTVAVAVWVARGLADDRREPGLAVFGGARPSFGTVVVDIVEHDLPVTGSFDGRLVAGPGANHFRLDGIENGSPLAVVGADGAVFASTDGIWTQVDGRGASTIEGAVAPIATVPIFDDFVPAAVRPFVTVVESEIVELRGREVRHLELLVDAGRLREADREGYDAWRLSDGVEWGSDRAPAYHLALWVDRDGLVWRMRTENRADGGGAVAWSAQYDLMSFGAAEYVVAPPPTGGISSVG